MSVTFVIYSFVTTAQILKTVFCARAVHFKLEMKSQKCTKFIVVAIVVVFFFNMAKLTNAQMNRAVGMLQTGVSSRAVARALN